MMTAPLTSRSHFEGELRYDSVDHVDPKESDMDGSTPRVSSASTETTAASTLASTVTPPPTTATTSSNTHMPTAEEEETTLVSPSAAAVAGEAARTESEAALSGTTTITSCLGEEEEEDPMLVKEKKDRLNMDSNRVSTMSLPDFSSAGLPEFNDTPPLQIQSVARMPSISSDQAEEIEQMMDLVQKLEEEEQKKKKSSTLNDQEDCKKPAATAARSKKNNASVSFADLPSIESTPDNLNSEELDQKPAAKPTATAIPTSPITTANNNNRLGNGRTGRPTALTDRQRSKSDASNNSTTGNIPTPRGRGLRGRRRQPQTAQDRETRRKQILENCSRSRSPVPPSSGSQASSLQSSQPSLQSISPMMNGPRATAAIGVMEPSTIPSSLTVSPLGPPRATVSSLPTNNAAATAMEPSVALTTPRSGAAAAAAAAAIVMEPTIPVTTPRTGAATASALASMEPSIVPVARRPRSQSPTATATAMMEPPTIPVAAKAPPRSRSPTPTRTPRLSPTRNNNNMNNPRNTTTPMPGDSLFGSRNRPPNAPGDNLSTRSPIRTRARTIRPLFSTAAQQQGQHGGSNNPAASGIRNNAPRPPAVVGGSSSASATNENGMNNSNSGNDDSDHSAKQRARRQNDDTSNLPSNIRPGAYKEIPGRGLIRNNTLRFSIMTSIANQKRSFRRMFSSSRRNSISGSDNFRRQRDLNASTNTNMSADNSTLGMSNQTDGNRNRRIAALASSATSLRGGGALQREASTRSVKSIQSVLVDDSERSNDRSYLGNISFRSLTQAKKGGLCVARPVYQREASMLEALCIIPGDLAVAEALDVQLNGEIQNNAAERLVALRSDNSASNINNNTSTTSASSVAVATATTKPASKKKPPPPPPPPPSEPPLTPGGSIRKRAKAKKVVETVVGTPIRLLKATPKALKASQRGLGGFVKNKVIGKLKHSHERRRSARMHAGSLDSGKKTKSAARLKVVKEDDPNNNHNNNATGEASTPAVRRHSF